MNRTAILVLLLFVALGALAFKLLQPLLSGEDAIKAEAARLHVATQTARLAMLELYASNGAWPRPEDLSGMAGLPLEVLPNGVMKVRIELPRYKVASAVYYRPERNGMGIRWACIVNDAALRAIESAIPTCSFEPAFDPGKFAFDDGSGPRQALASAGADPCPPATEITAPAAYAHEAAGFTFTPLGGGAYLLLGKLGAGGFPLPAVWNEPARALHAMDPFWNAVGHTATPVAERAVLIAGGRRANWSSGDETSDRVLLVAPCTRTVLGRGSLLTARRYHAAARLDEYRVLIAGGHQRRAPTAEVEIFDTRSMKSTPAAPMREPRAEALALSLPDGRVMLIGGVGARSLVSAELYDPESGEWSETGALSEPRRGGMAATVLGDGRVLLTGGGTPALGIPLNLAELWDPATGSWQRVTPMLTGRTEHASTLLPDGRVLVVGGAVSAYSEIYDPRQDTWTLGPPQPPRHKDTAEVWAPGSDARLVAAGLTAWNEALRLGAPRPPGTLQVWRTQNSPAALPDGRLLIAGGSYGADVLRHAEIFDPATGTSAETGPLHTRRQHHRTLVLPDGDVIVLGGKGAWTDKGELGEGALPAERWRRGTQQWTLLPDLRLGPDEAQSAALLDNGDILFFVPPVSAPRAQGDADALPPTRVLLWRQDTGEIEEQGTLGGPRVSFRAVALPGNRVLIAGGFERSRHQFTPAATTELWDVALRATLRMAQPEGVFPTGERNPPPPMVVRLPDGRALVAGAGGSAMYDAQRDRWDAGPPELKASTDRWLVIGDGRLVRVHKPFGQWPQLTLLDALTGATQTMRTPKGQCVAEGAVTSRQEVVLLTDHCQPGTPSQIERWRLAPVQSASR